MEDNSKPPVVPPPSGYSAPPQITVIQPVVDGHHDPMRFIAPVHTSGLAIIAGYLGLFSVLMVFGPFAIFFGALALRDLKQNPNKIGAGRAWFGIVMGALGTLGLMILLTSRG